MFCMKCGTQLNPDGTCPVCSQNPENKQKLFRAPDKGGKRSIAIISALTLIPTIFILMIDYVINYKIDSPATGYIVGALVVIWICCLLPSIKVTPAPVTGAICFISISAYIVYIVKMTTGNLEWLTNFALPLIACIVLFVTLNSALSRSNKFRGGWMATIGSFEAAVFCFVFKALYENYYTVTIGLIPRLAIISGCILLMLTVILAAAAYIGSVNRKP